MPRSVGGSKLNTLTHTTERLPISSENRCKLSSTTILGPFSFPPLDRPPTDAVVRMGVCARARGTHNVEEIR